MQVNSKIYKEMILNKNMWVAKYKIWHKNCLLRPKCVKHKVADFVYLINSWSGGKSFYYTELHILQGKEDDKKGFIKELRKEKTVKKLEKKGDYIFTLNQEPIQKKYYSPAFDSRIIQIKPIAQRTDGYEDWELASWDKATLMKILDIPVFDVELKFIKETKLGDIFLPHIYPKLPPKQKEAIELAVQNGYYEYPRKIDLERLSKIAKVKRQTYQESLRKAEKKLVPFLTENIM
jgi:predicted DNA binding protein